MSARIAMIGAGAVAARHVRVLSGLGARVVGVADPVPAAAGRLAADCGAAAYPHADALLDAETVDAAYVCVPPFAHGAPERAVLARRLPLFVEKPLAADRATAAELVPLVRAAGVVTGTGYHWRCLDTVQKAAELLAAAPARLVTGAWLDTVPPPPWWPRRDRSGGQVVEQLTHVLDLARVLVGEVDAVWGAASRAPDSPGDADDATAIAARFASGAVGTFTASSLLPGKRRASLETVSAGGLRLELSEQELVVERPGAEPEVLTPAVDGHEAVDREFLEAVAGQRSSTRAPYEQAWATHRLGLAMAAAADTGEPVRP
ncbi:MAG TPA: Gfo/Idh/MocA family oxidoreductase [Mycobacteriales bacterium]|nr:Gfo/Idh/MocA family oxidoreductase [Mycobacteriales bacterium]